MPETWRDFQYGLAALSRESARFKLRVSDAVAAANYVQRDRTRWRHEQAQWGGV